MRQGSPEEVGTGWIGVDLDGTLAIYDVWRGANHIGEPVPTYMIDSVTIVEHK